MLRNISRLHSVSRLSSKTSARLLATNQAHSFTVPNQANADLEHQFLANPKTGFLPRKDPLAKLPEVFAPLDNLLEEMPLTKKNGEPGLLAKYQFGEASKSVPDFSPVVREIKDTALLTALFRDYTFWASAYLLEPCHHNMLKAGDATSFGLGRDTLPVNIANPLCIIAEKLQAKPFMEYALSYALYNWKRIDPTKGTEFKNLELIRTFSGLESEAGFILVHVSMVGNSGPLVDNCIKILENANKNDREEFNKSLKNYQKIMRTINVEFETMWGRSKPKDYEGFRTFIMGTKGQPMFPNGVIYERRVEDITNGIGCYGEKVEGMNSPSGTILKTGPYAFRGESGANDSMIPTSDNLMELTSLMPDNPLTDILRDFRSYRPIRHNEFLTYVQESAKALKLREYSLQNSQSAYHYLTILDEIRDFRNRHWMLTKEYILKRTRHPVATGGSPIVTWLPNQLSAVLEVMNQTINSVNPKELDASDVENFSRIQNSVSAQLKVLKREVEELRKVFNQ